MLFTIFVKDPDIQTLGLMHSHSQVTVLGFYQDWDNHFTYEALIEADDKFKAILVTAVGLKFPTAVSYWSTKNRYFATQLTTKFYTELPEVP